MAIGRPPKPTALKIITGNPGKRALNLLEPVPVGDLSDPPEGLTDLQNQLWREAIANAPSGLLKKLDQAVLLKYAIAESFYRDAAQKVAQFGSLTKSPVKGEWMQNPYMAIMNKQALISLKACSELGFTPTSRSRINVAPQDDQDPAARFFAS